MLRSDTLNALLQSGKTRRANRTHRVSASGAKSEGHSKTGNPAPLSGALSSKQCFGSPKTSRRSHGANAEMRLPALTGGENGGARAAKAAHRKAREVARGTDKARTHSAEHRRQSGGRTSENGQRRRKWHPRNRTGSTQPPTGEGAKRRRRGGRQKAETKDRKHAPTYKGGARSDGDHIGQRQNLGSRTFRYIRLLPSERPLHYLI